uniref:Uncharacterized protein n=1 Tax=Anguilla anguilla TaxID=7936 RepID=A0A0E9S352_ANGAN
MLFNCQLNQFCYSVSAVFCVGFNLLLVRY